MTQRELYYANEGPLIYEDSIQYPDSQYREASRAPQHFIEDEPSEVHHVVRLSGLTSKLTSVVTYANSAIASAIAAGSADDTARSMATSAAVIAANAHGDAAYAIGAASTAQSSADRALSKLASHGL